MTRVRAPAVVGVVAVVLAVGIGAAGIAGVADVARAAENGTDHSPADDGDSWSNGTVQKETVLRGLGVPTAMTFLPDGRMLILEKDGNVLITDPDDGTNEVSTYLSLDVDATDSRGLLDVALDPNFDENGYVYLFYSHPDRDRNRVARFGHREAGGGLDSYADPSSETVIWEEERVRLGSDHEGGAIDFGPDGKLYVTTGEEFDASQAQNLSNDGGKILRLNGDGSVPEDNPFVDRPDVQSEIWAYGLRNPWRARWDVKTERLFVAEVGSAYYEDIHVGKRGANYGWPNCEGTCEDPDYVDPIYTYPHENDDAGSYPEQAITGGLVYRGEMLPERYRGAYFYGDYADGWIRYLTFEADGDGAASHGFDADSGAVVSFAEGPAGALYYGAYRGKIYRYVTYGPNTPPNVTATSVTPRDGTAPLEVSLLASATDPENDSLTRHWTIESGDGNRTTLPGADLTHTFDDPGTYALRWEVTDGRHATSSDPITVDVGAPPTATISAPENGSTFHAGDEITYRGVASDSDGSLSRTDYHWTVAFLHDSHVHPVSERANATRGAFTAPTSGHSFRDFTRYRITLRITDEDGLTDTATAYVYPEKVNVTLATRPRGLPIYLDGVEHDSPFSYSTLVGFTHTVRVDSSVCVDGTRYAFETWSDDGAASHEVTVPASNATYVARYASAGTCGGGNETGTAVAPAGNTATSDTRLPESRHDDSSTADGSAPVLDGGTFLGVLGVTVGLIATLVLSFSPGWWRWFE